MGNFVGGSGNVVIQYSPAGTDTSDPTALSDWETILFTTSKSVDLSPQTTTNTNDNSKGVVSNIVTRMDFTVSADYYPDEDPTANHNVIFREIANSIIAGDQPKYWIKVYGPKYPHVIYAWCIASAASNDNGTDDVSSGSYEFKTTDTDYSSSYYPLYVYSRED